MSEIVKKFYNENAEGEWERLVCDAYHSLEFIITTHLLEKHLPENGVILDAGGGPGRYTIALARKGYDLVLQDLSSECLAIARREITKANVGNKVETVVQGSITDLSAFSNDSFDGVLCLGALSHLVDQKDREVATSELIRVARKNAPLFVSVIGLYGVFRTILQKLPDSPITPSREEIFSWGIHRASESFPDAYFFHPTELRALFESHGVETVEMATCEGLSSHLKEATNLISEDKEKWDFWLQILYKTCSDPHILGLGEHFIYVGRKSM